MSDKTEQARGGGESTARVKHVLLHRLRPVCSQEAGTLSERVGCHPSAPVIWTIIARKTVIWQTIWETIIWETIVRTAVIQQTVIWQEGCVWPTVHWLDTLWLVSVGGDSPVQQAAQWTQAASTIFRAKVTATFAAAVFPAEAECRDGGDVS